MKKSSMFWYRIWEEAGCPSSGVLFQIKTNAKRRYKYEVHCLVRRQNVLLQKKLASSFARKNMSSFWSCVKNLSRSSSSSALVVDGVAIW